MLEISENDLLNRMRRDNPWWETGIDKVLEKDFPKRDFFPAFYHLVRQRDIRRAVVLMGPRQVGKTVMAKQAVLELLKSGVEPNHILFASLDTPLLIGQPLEKLLRLYLDSFGDEESGGYIFFDEIQYLKDWEIHLKSLVDSYPEIKFVVTGSAAAVLKRKSQESGAGRFTDFILPPLTFREFVKFQNIGTTVLTAPPLNDSFINYLTFGGYPEIVMSKSLRQNPDRYLKSDIIDKVLLRDLPSLYGITDVQEMYRLFASLVYNTGQEVSLESLSKNSGVSKVTLKKYIEYFEGAFLIRRLDRVDINAKKFKRARTFKIYVTNPSMYCALFGAMEQDDRRFGALVETAVIAQMLQSLPNVECRYARWKTGEIDFVIIDQRTQKPTYALEVKWSDRIKNNIREADNMVEFVKLHNLQPPDYFITTKTYSEKIMYRGIELSCMSTAKTCLVIGQTELDIVNANLEAATQQHDLFT
ncbi:MAG: ATP-binding protein [Robiginitomaculum sp.]|nr:ATP-binding protein [Robiginitomaculum sp.]